MTPIYVMAASKTQEKNFRAGNSNLDSIVFTSSSPANIIKDLIRNKNSSYALIISSETVLPKGFHQDLSETIHTLNLEWSGWGAAGNLGICPFAIGLSKGNLISYRIDSSSIPNASGTIYPASCLSTDVLLLNLKAIRGQGIFELPPHGAGEFDLALAWELTGARLGMVIAPQLATFQSNNAKEDFLKEKKVSKALGGHISDTSLYKEISTVSGLYKIPTLNRSSLPVNRLNLDKNALSFRRNADEKPSVTIAIRTQFKDLDLLNRTIISCAALIAAQKDCNFRLILLSDTKAPIEFSSWIQIEQFHLNAEEGKDSRLLLVEFGARLANSKHIWFIDDDDWMFPNEAAALVGVLKCATPESMVIVGSQIFYEAGKVRGQVGRIQDYKIAPRHYFSPARFRDSLSGLNQIPFSSVIWPVEFVRSIPQRSVNSITYAEDYFVLLHAMSMQKPIIIFDRLLVGISIRKNDNTVTETVRSRWNESNANIALALSNDVSYANLLSTHDKHHQEAQVLVSGRIIRPLLSLLFDSNSWKILWELNIPRRMISRQLSASEVIRKVLSTLK